MKLYLTAVLLLLISVKKTYSQIKNSDKFKRLLFKEYPQPSKEDSLDVINFIDSLNIALKIDKFKFVTNKTGTSHFILGTMYINKKAIDSGKVLVVYTGELPHAEQMVKKPIITSFQACKGFLETFVNYFFLTKLEKKEVKKLMSEEKCSKWKAKAWVAYKRQYKEGKYEGVHKRDPFFHSLVMSRLSRHYYASQVSGTY